MNILKRLVVEVVVRMLNSVKPPSREAVEDARTRREIEAWRARLKKAGIYYEA